MLKHDASFKDNVASTGQTSAATLADPTTGPKETWTQTTTSLKEANLQVRVAAVYGIESNTVYSVLHQSFILFFFFLVIKNKFSTNE